MKKKLLFIMLLAIMLTTGCFKRDNLEGINIVTTVYPIEYVTNYLYSDHSNVLSIYPDDVNTKTYTLSKKQVSDYSKKDLFVYNGLSNDKDITKTFLDKNSKMLIIDAAYGMELNYDEAELWLNPSNLLMMTQNIRNGLKEYMTNSYLEKSLDEKYEELKVKLSELDAEIKLTANNATRKTIIVNSDTLKYLEKYGFTVISLDDSNKPISDKTLQDAKKLISDGLVKHIFLLEKKDNSETLNNLIEETKIDTYTFRLLDNITDQERDEFKDYIYLMNENISLLKDELY